MRRNRTGSKSGIRGSMIWRATGVSVPVNVTGRLTPAARLSSSRQVRDQGVGLVRGHVVHVLVIDHHRRRTLAGAQALRELQRDLAVAAGAAGADLQLLAEMIQQLITAAQTAGEAAADPQACLAERV